MQLARRSQLCEKVLPDERFSPAKADIEADNNVSHAQSFRASNAQVAAMSSYCVWGGSARNTERRKPAGVRSDGRSGAAPITSSSNFLRAARLW